MNYITPVQRYLEEKFSLSKRGIRLAPTTELFEQKIIDSIGMMELLMFVEETYNIEVPEDELTPDNFGTLDKLSTYIRRKTG